MQSLHSTNIVVGGEDDPFCAGYNISGKYPAKVVGSVNEVLAKYRNSHLISHRECADYA